MNIIDEVKNLYRIIELKPFRKTEGVIFDLFPMDSVAHVDSIDRVLHDHSAVSPGPVGSVSRPWYMHPHQDDNLLVHHEGFDIRTNFNIYDLNTNSGEYHLIREGYKDQM